jgi:hypothetical protein
MTEENESSAEAKKEIKEVDPEAATGSEPTKRRFDPERLGEGNGEDRDDDERYMSMICMEMGPRYASYVILERAVPHADDG